MRIAGDRQGIGRAETRKAAYLRYSASTHVTPALTPNVQACEMKGGLQELRSRIAKGLYDLGDSLPLHLRTVDDVSGLVYRDICIADTERCNKIPHALGK